MFYPYTIMREDDRFICRIPDLDFYSVGSSEEEAFQKMSDGLIHNIDLKYRKEGQSIPLPSEPVKGRDSLFYINIHDEARFLLWNALKERRVSIAELGRMLKISRQQAHHMVSGANSVSMDKYCEAFEALGYYLSLELNPYK